MKEKIFANEHSKRLQSISRYKCFAKRSFSLLSSLKERREDRRDRKASARLAFAIRVIFVRLR